MQSAIREDIRALIAKYADVMYPADISAMVRDICSLEVSGHSLLLLKVLNDVAKKFSERSSSY